MSIYLYNLFASGQNFDKKILYPEEEDLDAKEDTNYSDRRNNREKVTRNIFQNPPRNNYRNY